MYGSDRLLLDVVGALSPRGDLEVVLNNDGPLAACLREMSIEVSFIELGVIRRQNLNLIGLVTTAIKAIRATLRIRRKVVDQRINIVYSNTAVVLAGAFAAKLSGARHIWHVHEIVDRPRLFAYLTIKAINALSDRVIAVSQAVATALSGGRRSSKVAVVHDSLPERSDIEDPASRSEFDIPDDVFLVALVGRIHEKKGQDWFIDCLRVASDEGLDIRALIIGDIFTGHEPFLQSLTDKIHRLQLDGAITFCGFRNDVSRLMKLVDLLVLPSQSEGFGLVILEAMAAGKPVLATRSGGPEEIVVDGETGFLVEHGDTMAMADRLRRLATDPTLCSRLGTMGLKRLAQEFGPDRFRSAIARTVILDQNEGS